MSDHIDVSGTGTAQARPDRLVARLGAEGIGPDVAAALAAGESAARAMAEAARTAGVVDGDVRTEDMSVGQHHDQQGQPSGYRAWLGLTVTLRDVDGAGAVLGDVLAAGGDEARLLGVSLAVSDPSAALEEARAGAVADARAQAEHLAALAGRGLGAVRRISSVAEPGMPRPIAMAAKGVRAAAMPVEAGEASVTVSLQVRFDLD
ncbi:MAG TPA: SIMPL domain-containing protein [Actinomycetes bacterium]|nr:SIMPL domain-containing protein [Actinomycetes bacterium]